jgi:ribose transport system permease protein
MVRQAIPLAILAACQTIAMLTGGIDLSAAAIASMSGFLVATLVGSVGLPAAVLIAIACAALAGLVNGIGIGVFRVHPLIMTLAMSLIVFGLSNVWQVQRVQTGSGVPAEFRSVGAGTFLDIFPISLFLFVPLAALILLLLHRTGYGRLLYAIGDNPIAARLSGVRSWQVLVVLYVLSGVLAGIAGFVYSGFINQVSVSLVDLQLLPSVAAAVIGGTSILGGRGGYGGTIVGALILTVASALLNALGFKEADRLILFGAIIILFTAAYARITSDT